LRPARSGGRLAGRARAPHRRMGSVGPADRAAEHDRPGDDPGHGGESAGARRRTGRAARRLGPVCPGDRCARRPALAARRADPSDQHRPDARGQRPRFGLARFRRGGAAGRRILDRGRRPAAPAVASARASGRDRRSGPFHGRDCPRRGGRGAPGLPSLAASEPARRRRLGLPRGDGSRPTRGLPRSRRAGPAGHRSGRRQGAGAHARAGGARSRRSGPASGRRAGAPAPAGRGRPRPGPPALRMERQRAQSCSPLPADRNPGPTRDRERKPSRCASWWSTTAI
jgi:hypothetical protein